MRNTLFILLTLIVISARGQNFLSWKFSDRYFSLSAGTGSASYFGDINSRNKINGRLKLVNMGLEARLLNHFSARIEGVYYTLQSKDSWANDDSIEEQRNLSFTSRNVEGNFQVIYYIKPYQGDYFRRLQFDPYVGAGVGITTYDPFTYLNGEKYYLREIETEPDKKYGSRALVIPVTAGVKFKINEFANLIFEAGYRFTTTDYLDDVSTVFIDPLDDPDNFILHELSNRKNEIPVVNPNGYDKLIPGSSRGDTRAKDSYLLLSLKVEIFLPSNLFSGGKVGLKKSSVN